MTTRKECHLVKSCLEGKFIKVWLLPRLGGQGDGQAKTYRCLIQMVETPAKIMKKKPKYHTKWFGLYLVWERIQCFKLE